MQQTSQTSIGIRCLGYGKSQHGAVWVDALSYNSAAGVIRIFAFRTKWISRCIESDVNFEDLNISGSCPQYKVNSKNRILGD